MDKKDYRETALYLRESLNKKDVEYTTRGICEAVKDLDVYKNAKDICLYMHINNEVILDSLMNDAFKNHKNIWLPKIIDKEMNFYRYHKTTKLIEGSYGISEPESKEILSPDEHTLIIMPGVVFSEDKKRICYGGGYYDRYLNSHPCCHTVAVCFELQIFPDIPTDEHDIRPDIIITDERVIV